MKLRLLVLATAALLIAADDPIIEARKDRAKLQGGWVFVAIEENGSKIPEDQVKARGQHVRWVFSDDKLSLVLGGEQSAGSYRLDAGRKPREMDIKDCFAKGTVVQCIYAFNGEQLNLCVGSKRGGERPTQFSARAKSGHALYVFKRAPPMKNDDD